MRSRLSCFVLLGVMLCASVAPATWGQSFAGSGEPAEFEGVPASLSTPDNSLYNDGMRAINDSRWANAEAIFTMAANQHGDHSDGALYWKSYAQKKQGHTKIALETCASLANQYPASSWNHDCTALAIEIGAEDGKPVEPNALKDDDLRLLALNVLMQKDESQALAQIQEILNGDYSEKLKKEAFFILGHHYSDETYAQIVRISYVEGDVRIARGEDNEKPAGAVWEKAVANLPLETGFSLVTGAGRAEIEFEDDSTLYLGENSVLTFNDLHTTSGAPYTDIGLLAGIVSTNLFPNIPGEQFFLRTPTNTFAAKYQTPWNVRISSYLDGDADTAVSGRLMPVSLGMQPTGAKGQTQYVRDGHPVDLAGPKTDADSFADWDKWVADRVDQRTAAIQEMMKASGLTSLIPGLADLKGQGTFFDCAPYGTCWEPKAPGADDRPSAGDKVSRAWPPASGFAQGAHLVRADFHPATRFGGIHPQIGLPDPLGMADVPDYFPCFPAAVRYRTARDPITGASTVVDTGLAPSAARWNWAVCHAGTWVQRRHHYCWVVGHKRHHVAPVRWVKSEHKVAIVPLHPFDVKGRPPINRKEEVFAFNNKNGLSIQRMKFEPGRPIEELKSPPREFRNSYMPPLSRAEAPHMEAHVMKDGPLGARLIATKGVPLTFNAKLQTFNMSREVMHGTKLATVSTPVTNHGGTLQARGDSFAGGHGPSNGGHGGFTGGHGGYSGGGGARSGGSGGSGGSHGGGGSSGGGSGGGGSHGGGGGGGGSSSGGGGGASAGGGGGGSHR